MFCRQMHLKYIHIYVCSEACLDPFISYVTAVVVNCDCEMNRMIGLNLQKCLLY